MLSRPIIYQVHLAKRLSVADPVLWLIFHFLRLF